jgi:hypothetical protein
LMRWLVLLGGELLMVFWCAGLRRPSFAKYH